MIVTLFCNVVTSTCFFPWIWFWLWVLTLFSWITWLSVSIQIYGLFILGLLLLMRVKASSLYICLLLTMNHEGQTQCHICDHEYSTMLPPPTQWSFYFIYYCTWVFCNIGFIYMCTCFCPTIWLWLSILICFHDSLSLVYLYGCLDSSYWGHIANEGIGLIHV